MLVIIEKIDNVVKEDIDIMDNIKKKCDLLKIVTEIIVQKRQDDAFQ